MQSSPAHERIRRDLGRALHPGQADGADTIAVGSLDRAAGVLLRAVPADVWCGVMLDPSTMLDTGGVHDAGFPAEVMPRLFEIEHAEQDDVDNIRALARRPAAASLLSASTRGDLASSKYYREILRPLGLADELRVMLRDGRRTWGLFVLCRAAGSPGFSAGELALAGEVSGPTTSAIRRALLVNGVDNGATADAPGLVLLDDDQQIRAVSPTAQAWLDTLPESPREAPRCPYTVRAIASRVRRPAGPAAVTGHARARSQTRTGKWVTLHAWRIDQDGEPLTAVSLGPAEPGELTAIILDAYGLTDREKEVTGRVLLGHSTKEIAAGLHVTAYTVQDHLKAVFTKTGVRSRRELVAQVFFHQYAPLLGRGPLVTDGRRPHIGPSPTTPTS